MYWQATVATMAVGAISSSAQVAPDPGVREPRLESVHLYYQYAVGKSALMAVIASIAVLASFSAVVVRKTKGLFSTYPLCKRSSLDWR